MKEPEPLLRKLLKGSYHLHHKSKMLRERKHLSKNKMRSLNPLSKIKGKLNQVCPLLMPKIKLKKVVKIKFKKYSLHKQRKNKFDPLHE